MTKKLSMESYAPKIRNYLITQSFRGSFRKKGALKALLYLRVIHNDKYHGALPS